MKFGGHATGTGDPQKRGHVPWISAIVKVNTTLTLVIGELEMITVEEHESIRRAYYPRSGKARGRSHASRGIPAKPSRRRLRIGQPRPTDSISQCQHRS